MNARTAVCTAAALLAFAGNSLLCRLALGHGAIDPASFTWVRLLAGALALMAIRAALGRRGLPRGQAWRPAIILLVYAVPFSLAYVSLSTGTGALILFGTVQVTMITVAIVAGERLHPFQWGGLLVAVAGLAYLVWPGVTAPPLSGALLMSAAGVAWAFYTLAGRHAVDPVDATAANFVRTIPAVAVFFAAGLRGAHITPAGALLAAVSGAVTSGAGYVVWYVALRGLGPIRAALAQLGVPLIAALLGVLLLGERFTLRLSMAAVFVIGGIALGLLGRERSVAQNLVIGESANRVT